MARTTHLSGTPVTVLPGDAPDCQHAAALTGILQNFKAWAPIESAMRALAFSCDLTEVRIHL